MDDHGFCPGGGGHCHPAEGRGCTNLTHGLMGLLTQVSGGKADHFMAVVAGVEIGRRLSLIDPDYAATVAPVTAELAAIALNRDIETETAMLVLDGSLRALVRQYPQAGTTA